MTYQHLASLALAAAVGLSGCKAFDETLLDPPDVGPGCDLNRPPPRPEGDGSGDDGEVYFYAMRDLQMDQREGRWETIGYDLDGICSEGDNPRVECLAPGTPMPETDGQGGTDNNLGKHLLPIILVSLDGVDEELRSYQAVGLGVSLVKITNWNGQPNDARVTAVMSQSIFATSRDPGAPVETWSIADSMTVINGEIYPPPDWDGEDVFYARGDGYLADDPDQPRVFDNNAYIADDMLVMALPDRFPITFGGDMRAVSFFLADVTATIQLSADHQTVERAIVAGRFARLDFLSTLSSAGICPTSRDYMSVQRLLDLTTDVRAIAGTGGPGAECDALSVGLLFETGIRARLGGVIPMVGIPTPCSGVMDGGVDAAIDGGVDAAPDAPRDTGTPIDTSTPDTATPDTGSRDAGADADTGS